LKVTIRVMNKLKLAVLFGGRSPEHEVSIISALQVLNALDQSKYDLLPVYISKDGKWILGDETFLKPETFRDLKKITSRNTRMVLSPETEDGGLVEINHRLILLRRLKKEKVDLFIPVFHGRFGEDGSIQGLFELAGAAYAGCGLLSSAIGIDKIASKLIAKSLNIPTSKGILVTEIDWRKQKSRLTEKLSDNLNFPLYVKPARLGSTIGVSRVESKKGLTEALEVAFFYDTRVLVEEGLKNAREINISLMGNNPYRFSVCEEPVTGKELLSFEDKYLSGSESNKGMAGAKRKIPALIKKTTERKIKDYAKEFFTHIDGKGIARLDFLISKDEKTILFNEINTMPGSLAFYLWAESGINFSRMLDQLIKLALENKQEKDKLTTVFKSNILANFKGIKGGKL